MVHPFMESCDMVTSKPQSWQFDFVSLLVFALCPERFKINAYRYHFRKARAQLIYPTATDKLLSSSKRWDWIILVIYLTTLKSWKRIPFVCCSFSTTLLYFGLVVKKAVCTVGTSHDNFVFKKLSYKNWVFRITFGKTKKMPESG